MINNVNDFDFIHNIGGLDSLRKQSLSGDTETERAALEAAGKQFESIFTNMLFKSMRDANSAFKSDLFDDQTSQFYNEMLDEQMASNLSAEGSLGLADMIVAQLSASQSFGEEGPKLENSAPQAIVQRRNRSVEQGLVGQSVKSDITRTTETSSFVNDFVNDVQPYAEKAAELLGVEPSLLMAQAALETGWGEKIIPDQEKSSNNLFNIKAQKGWVGSRVNTETTEYLNSIPVKEVAEFRAYPSVEESFDDYVEFLNKNQRYQSALETSGNSEEFIRNIHKAGYATDPLYSEKVLRVKETIDEVYKS